MAHSRKHYAATKTTVVVGGKRVPLEAIHVIEAFDLPRNLANVAKYTLRADRKGQREADLEKIINYAWRERYGTWANLPKEKR